MSEVLVLRFRDLVTEPGGTIYEHRRIIEAMGYVWWGWWMRQYEIPPSALFEQIYETIRGGVEPEAYLFDSGRAQLHQCRVSDIRVAPEDTIGPPELEAAPHYYQRGSYPAWFKLSRIDAQWQTDVPEGWRFSSFPSNASGDHHSDLVGTPVESLDQVRSSDATLWVMSIP